MGATLGKLKVTVEVKAGLLRSTGFLFLGKERGVPDRKKELTHLRVIRELGRFTVSGEDILKLWE